jgi:murein DD-endopeptidase MepM/ murein hydrolase activator NlpD
MDSMVGIRLNVRRFAGQVIDRLRTFQFTQWLRTSRLFGSGDAAKPVLLKADERYAILAQSGQPSTSQTRNPASGRSPARVRVGLAGFAVIILGGGWFVWSSLPFNASAAGGQERALRPTFTPTPKIEGIAAIPADTPTAAPIQIVVVTPTPNPDRLVTVGGAIIDRPLAVAGSEHGSDLAGSQPLLLTDLQPAVAGLGGGQYAPHLANIAFDPSSVVVPPMVEEIVNEPLAQVEVIPIPGLEPIETPISQPTFVPPPTPTPLPELVVGPIRKWSTFQPLPPEQSDHLWVGPAFLESEGYNQIGAPSYQFGSTGGGRYRPHHGLDVANPYGSPVRSGVSGEVVHAGMDDPVLLGPYNNFYGNAVVIRLDQKLSVGSGDLDVFLLYGHLSQVNVQQGQHVNPEDVVGAVGMTGIAIGPHLHIEMRIGANTYENSANPYLWLKPLPGNGAVAVRVLTADGLSWPGARLTLARFENGQAVWGRMIETYRDDENIGPDPIWGENGAMGDVPAGYYILVGNVNGESIRAEFFVRAGQTTFVEVRTDQ